MMNLNEAVAGAVASSLYPEMRFSWEIKVNKRTMFENCLKSHIKHCERSELRIHSGWTKNDFLKTKACGQTMLPDIKIIIRYKLVEKAQTEYSNATF